MKPILIMFAAAGLAGCSENPDWKGWVYPNKSDLTRDIPIGAFATLEECRNSARPLLANFNLYIGEEKIEGDYECGYRCKKESGTGGLNVCERTER